MQEEPRINHDIAIVIHKKALSLYAEAAAATAEDPRPLGNAAALLLKLGRCAEDKKHAQLIID